MPLLTKPTLRSRGPAGSFLSYSPLLPPTPAPPTRPPSPPARRNVAASLSPASTSSALIAVSVSPRLELDAEPDDFNLWYHPATFEIKPEQRPPQRNYYWKQIPDSPTLGAVDSLASTAVASSTGGDEDGEDGVGRGQSRSVEGDMATLGSAPETDASDGADCSDRRDEVQSIVPLPSHVVDPATIPVRTSSSKAVANGAERVRTDREPSSPRKSPRKHKSLGAVPEERRYSSATGGGDHRDGNSYATRAHPDERDWLAQGQRHTINGHAYGLSSTSAYSDGGGTPAGMLRDGHKYSGSTFSQQPTVVGGGVEPTFSGAQEDPFRVAVGVDLVNGHGARWNAEKENILTGPFDYLEAHPGKDIRSQLIAAFNVWLRVPRESLDIITKAIGMLHTASLLVDDVEDSSDLRRGVPVAHHIFGSAQTINSANYIYFCALRELLKLNNPDAIQIYTDELLNLHRGQGMDLFWRDTLTCPTEDDYLEMVSNKTGGLFRLAIKLMCAESPSHNFRPHHPRQRAASSSADDPANAHDGGIASADDGPTDYIPLVNTIGLLFQILDDYYNLCNPSYTSNKGLCEDLTEGKFSFPIIHAIRFDPSNLVLINILKQKTRDEEVKRYAVAYMERAGSFAYTRRVLRGLGRKAAGLVDEVERKVGASQGASGIGGAGKGPGGGDGVRLILERLRIDRHSRASQSV